MVHMSILQEPCILVVTSVKIYKTKNRSTYPATPRDISDEREETPLCENVEIECSLSSCDLTIAKCERCFDRLLASILSR